MKRGNIILCFIFIILASLLFGCKEQITPIITSENQSYESNVGAGCTNHSECKTPMDYLIRSNCPFSSACIEGRCKVICPFTRHNPDSQISASYPLPCEKNSDCDCSDRQTWSIKCLCIDGGCVSVEAE